MLKLSIQDSEGRSTLVPLSDGELSIGRDEANSICLTDRNVSRQHARLTTKSGHVYVENVTATYGTRLNNLLLRERTELHPGDVIQVGDYVLELLSDEKKRDNAMREEPAPAPTQKSASQSAPPPPPPVAKGKSSGSDTAIVDLNQLAAMMQDDKPANATNIPEGAQPRLVVESENLRGLELRITKTPIVVGRVRENSDLVVDHRSISKEHARLTRQSDGTWQVLDLGSANGLKVNGEPFAKCDIRTGDRIELGHVSMRFLAAGAKAPSVAESKGGKPNAMIFVAVGIVVVLIGAVAVFAMTRGDKDKPEDKVKDGVPVDSTDKPDDKAGAAKGDDKPEAAPEAPGEAPAVDAAQAIKGAEKLALMGEYNAALKQLEACTGPQCELARRRIEIDKGNKEKLDEAEGLLDSNPLKAKDTAAEVKESLKAGSPLHASADSILEMAGRKIADKKQAVAPRAAVDTPRPTPKPREAAPPVEKAPPKPVVEKAPPVKKAPPPAEAVKKTPADLYKEGRDAMLAGNSDGAVTLFKQAAAGGYGKAHGQLARVYFQKGDKGQCARNAKLYLDKYPDAGDAQQIQGMLEKCSN